MDIVFFRSAHLSCYPRSALADRKQNVDQNAHMASGDLVCRLKYLKYRKLLIQHVLITWVSYTDSFNVEGIKHQVKLPLLHISSVFL